jgi:Zn-dependent protease
VVPVARGVRLKTRVPLSYRQELIVALAGPVANLACALLGKLCGSFFPCAIDFGQISLVTALCNLIPMAELDGEKILNCLLAPCMSADALYRSEKCLSALTLFCSLFGSLSVLWLTGDGTYPAMLCLAALLTAPIPCTRS